MIILVCGDRNWTDSKLIYETLKSYQSPVTLINGGAVGADTLAEIQGNILSFNTVTYHANWSKHHRAAGPIRNKLMLTHGKPDLVIAFHDNISESLGTKNMINQALAHKVDVLLVSHSKDGKFVNRERVFHKLT